MVSEPRGYAWSFPRDLARGIYFNKAWRWGWWQFCHHPGCRMAVQRFDIHNIFNTLPNFLKVLLVLIKVILIVLLFSSTWQKCDIIFQFFRNGHRGIFCAPDYCPWVSHILVAKYSVSQENTVWLMVDPDLSISLHSLYLLYTTTRVINIDDTALTKIN